MGGQMPSIRHEMIRLLGRIVGDGPVPDDIRRQALAMYAAILESPDDRSVESNLSLARSDSGTTAEVADDFVGTRRLIYVHGICRHAAGFSNDWWVALAPFLPGTFGPGILGQTRLEVVWSDLVNQAAAQVVAQATAIGARQIGEGTMGAAEPRAVEQWQQASSDIKESLRDRADQSRLAAGAPLGDTPSVDGVFDPGISTDFAAGISIPGITCIDDFAVYLTVDSTRQRILDRFINKVRPQLQSGRVLTIIAHSWGTVVAYEGLRQLEDEGFTTPLVRQLFTVGAALSIPPVKSRLRATNRDGKKPANTHRWINLDARGDIVGGPLKGRPYAVDEDFVNLEPTGCGSLLGIVNPQCAHSSYFAATNTAVNRDIFANRLAL